MASDGRSQDVHEPPLAADAPIDLPKGLEGQLGRASSDATMARRLQQHATAAFAALDQRDGATAVPHLRFLKSRLPRLGFVREALGVALYLSEQFDAALTELQAFRRLTGLVDQHHLIADALRAVGDGAERIPELVSEMEQADEPAPEAVWFEARIVWASWLADRGDPGAGRAVVGPLLGDLPPDEEVEEHHLRAWYVAGDLAQQAGDADTARMWFSRITELADGFYDTDDRIASLLPVDD